MLNIHKRILGDFLLILKRKYENNDFHYALNTLKYIVYRYLTVLILLFNVILCCLL